MRHYSTPLSIAIGTALLSLPLANALAESTLPPVSIGAGVRTSFTHKDIDAPGTAGDSTADDFKLDSARLYISGKVMENVSLMFNTEYNGADQSLVVMDAAAQFAFSDSVNIWAGRFLPPSDRANLYGPYYASNWGVYQDGVQDGYPSTSIGRDDGVMYWGQFGIAKVSAGLFDVPATTGDSKVLSAARVQLDFWDPEGGYYLNGTYYGDKDLLAVGAAVQSADGESAYSLDALFEKKLGGAGVLTLEAEYAKYDGLGGYIGGTKSDGWYVLGAYLFAPKIGIGQFQVLAKAGTVTFKDNTPPISPVTLDQNTFEFDLNYVIKQFNCRVSAFYIDTDQAPSAPANSSVIGKQYGIGLQVQM
jgi:hypothetical protein